MSSQQTAKLMNNDYGNPERRKRFLKWLSSLKDITFTTNVNADLRKKINQKVMKTRISAIKQHKQDPNLYVWQDFLTIFQLTSEHVEKMSLLLPKGYSFVSKDNIPENIKTTLGHYARRMNLKGQYELKQAQQALKNPVSQEELCPQKIEYSEHEQTAVHLQPSQNKLDQTQREKISQVEQKDFTNQNKVVLNLKKGQKMVDDLSVFAHPIYQKMRNIVVFKRMLHPTNYAKQKEKQIRKQREKQRLKRIKQARKSKIKRMAERQREQRRKRVELRKQQKLYKKDVKQRKNNRTLLLSKKQPKTKISFENPKLNLQLAAVKELMQKLQKHEHFPVLQEGKTTPTVKFLLKVLAAKIQKNYKVHQFQTDLLRIFKVFYKTSKEKMIVMRNIRNYQKFMKNAIQDKKIIFTNSENQGLKLQQSQVKIAQAKLINKEVVDGKTKNKHLERFPKKNQEYDVKDIQKLGKNVCRLNQRNIEQFCIQFCGQESQKLQGNSYVFQFDFNKENTVRLLEMQKFVRQKLEQQKAEYVELSDNDLSEQFILDNDD